jgi:hypothetical protein
MDPADQVEGLDPNECFAAGMAILSGSSSSSQRDRAIAVIEAASAHGLPDATEKSAQGPLSAFELTQFFHYGPGQEFKLHHDYLDPANPEYRKHLDTNDNGSRLSSFI